MADKLAIMERNGKISFESEQTAKVIERCQSKLEVNRSPPASAELAIPKNPTFRFWGGSFSLRKGSYFARRYICQLGAGSHSESATEREVRDSEVPENTASSAIRFAIEVNVGRK